MEVRTHLGVETQRQWSDLAILRTTPVLLGLFSMITVWASALAASDHQLLRPHAASWYNKNEPTFTDAIAAVLRVLWSPQDFSLPIRLPHTAPTCSANLREMAPLGAIYGRWMWQPDRQGFFDVPDNDRCRHNTNTLAKKTPANFIARLLHEMRKVELRTGAEKMRNLSIASYSGQTIARCVYKTSCVYEIFVTIWLMIIITVV